MPNYPCEFELPDEWWLAAGMESFTPAASAYRSTAASATILLRDIEPPPRATPNDWRGFDRERLISVLSGIAAGADIPPVPVDELRPINDWSQQPYKYRVRDGFHRYYASIAAGFRKLPALIYT
jgi:hypothetical protein